MDNFFKSKSDNLINQACCNCCNVCCKCKDCNCHNHVKNNAKDNINLNCQKGECCKKCKCPCCKKNHS